MFNVAKIQSALVGIVGFRQPLNPDYAIVNAENLLSTSGYFVTDNTYAKIEFIKDTQDYTAISDAEFNTFLENLKKSSVSNVCSQVFAEAQTIDRNLLYRNAFNKIDTENLPSGFVGYRIRIGDTKNIAFTISRVLLDFAGAGDIKLLLWNSAQKAVLREQDITISSDHQIQQLDWTIDDSEGVYKGEYYIGYLSGGLAVQPYSRNYRDASQQTHFNHLDITKVIVPDHATETLFDLSKTEGTSLSLGLNFDISVHEDYTDFIIQHKHLFGYAVYLQAAIQCLRIYVTSLRQSANQQKALAIYKRVMTELKGVKGTEFLPGSKGLESQLITELTSIKSSVDNLKEALFGDGFYTITEE